MTKPNTIQDLGGDVTERDVDRMACRLFNDLNEMNGVIDGYVVKMQNFEDLPDACKQFIRKAIRFSTVTNILDVKPEDTGGLYGSDDSLYTQENIDAHGTEDGDPDR